MSDRKEPKESLRIGPGRMSFPAVFEPSTNEQGASKYELTLLLPPSYDTKPILNLLKKAWAEKFGTDPKKWPRGPTVRTPDAVIRDCSEKPQYAGYEEGWHFVVARSDNPPDVVDGTQPPNAKGEWKRATDKREVYPGRWAIMSVNAFGYVNKTSGVSLGLNNVMLRRHDTPFGGVAPKPEHDFDGVEYDTGGEEEESALD